MGRQAGPIGFGHMNYVLYVALLSIGGAMFGARCDAAAPDQPAAAGAPEFYPAYFDAGLGFRLVLYPPDGPELIIPLPPQVSANTRVITFGPDGRTIYVQNGIKLTGYTVSIGKIEFSPPRFIAVPGSAGILQVDCLAVSQPSGRLTMFSSWTDGRVGLFDLDPDTGHVQVLSGRRPSVCGGLGGLASPDGNHVVSKSGKYLAILDTGTGAVHTVPGLNANADCVWSPSGRWLACAQKDEITLVDAQAAPVDRVRSRKLAKRGDAYIAWSPDSQYLLIRKPSLSCLFSLYGENLEIINVASGKRRSVKSSHCEISAGAFGWMDQSIAHGYSHRRISGK